MQARSVTALDVGVVQCILVAFIASEREGVTHPAAYNAKLWFAYTANPIRVHFYRLFYLCMA